MPMLVVERGNDKGLSLKVEAGKVSVVGRDNPQAALKLTDPMASRAHFQISGQDAGTNGTFKVRDMKSRNGTLLNDERLPPDADAELKIGDKIQVGETIFSFLSDQKEETTGGLVGKTIGGYVLQERVGRGGMGTVYKAEQVSLKRVVALKVLSAKLLSDPVFVERFVQEARAAGGLNHPNIVQVFDVGSDRGVYYFSMEFMDHGSVGDIVQKEGPVPWQRALEMLTDASRGLIFAEKRGVVHRDIKPDNLMLTEEGTVKIGDLGLAKKAAELGGEGGQIFGTPHFIAPEQAQGKPIDHRADIYALGATFYRVLSGRTPFSGENVKEILLKQIQEEPPPLKKLVVDMPEELASVVGKMMQKRADDRYRSAQGLFEDLETIRVRYHLEAHGERLSARRSKAIAIVAVILVLAVGGYAYHLATRPKEDPGVIYKEMPGKVTEVPTVDPAVVLANEARLVFGEVQAEVTKLTQRLKGLGPVDTWKEHEAEWEAIARKFDAIEKKYSTTPHGPKAKEEAHNIRTEMADAKKQEQERIEKAKKAWEDLLAETERQVAEDRPADAIVHLLEKAAALAGSKDCLGLDPEKTALERAKAIAEAAEAAVRPKIQRLEEAAPLFPGTDYVEARRALEALRGGLTPQVPGKDPASERMRTLAEDARKALSAGRIAAREAAFAAIVSDTEEFFRTYMRIRRWAPDDPTVTVDSPFFDYRWDDAIKMWNDLHGRLKTQPFRDRVDAKVLQYQRCRRLFETIAARVRSKALKDPQFPEAVRRRGNVLLDTQPDQLAKASADGVAVLRVSGSTREKAFVRFGEMTPGEIHEFFLKKGGKDLPFSAEERLDLAVFLFEAGAGDLAYAEFGLAKQGNPALDAALEAWISDEFSIYFEYCGEGGIQQKRRIYEAVRAEAAKGTRRWEEVEILRRDLKARIDEFKKADRAYRTDFFIVNFSNGGPDGPVPRRLFPDAVTNAVIQKYLGTGSDIGPPPEEEEKPKEEDSKDKPAEGEKEGAPPKEGPPPPDGPPPGGGDPTEKPK